MIKVAFVIEYFPPHAMGGAEWSTYYLAKELIKHGISCVVITPNLGSSAQEIMDGIKVMRYPFYLKPKNNLPGHFSYTNPIWVLWSAVFLYIYLKGENVDIIHIQGKYSIPPTILANIFLKKPTIATIRDYIAVCNYGLCLITKDKGCNLREYFFQDFKNYFQLYVENKNPLTFVLNLLFAMWGRLTKNVLKFFVNKVDHITVMSAKTKKILRQNSISVPLSVQHNTYPVKLRPKNTKVQNNILFVGRLTYGKGVNLLLDAIERIKKNLQEYRFLFIGSGSQENKIRRLGGNIELIGQLKHSELTKYYQEAKLTVIPSLWPDPLPRVLIESLLHGTPVVVTSSGGMPEIVKDGVWGYVAEKNSESLAKQIEKGIYNNNLLRKNIQTDLSKIKKMFGSDVINSYKNLYKSMLS